MKALELVHSLSRTEKQDFDVVIKNKKRKELVKLWSYLWKTPKRQVNKERMYRAAYGKKYHKDKDYLLRNELRKLNSELRNFLIDQEVQQEWRNNESMADAYYLRSLYHRGLIKEFDDAFDAMFEKAQSTMQMHAAHEMSQVFAYRCLDRWHEHLDIKMMILAANRQLQAAQDLSRLNIRKAEFRQAQATRLIKFLSNKEPDELNPKPQDTLDLNSEHPYIKGRKFLIQAYPIDGPERIELVGKAIACFKECDYPNLDMERLLTICYSILSIHYGNLGNNDLMIHYAKLCFDLSYTTSYNPTVLLANYVRSLNIGERHQEALALIEQYYRADNEAQQSAVLLTAVMETYVVNRAYDKGLEILREMNTRHFVNYASYKFALAIIFYLQGEYDLALVEISNLITWSRKNEQLTTDQHKTPQFDILKHIINLKKQNKLNAGSWPKVEAELNAIPEELRAHVSRIVLFNHILKQARESVQ